MPPHVHLVFGDEYLATAKAKALLADAGIDLRDPLAAETIDGQVETVSDAVQSLARVREALTTVGFFGGRKVVWYRGVNFLTESKVGRSEEVKAAVGRLAELLKAGLPEGVGLVVSAGKVDKRFALYRAVQEVGALHEFTIPEKAGPLRQHAAAVLDRGLEQTGIGMAVPVREEFLDRVGADARTILNEVAKLATYLGKRKQVELADVAAITSTAGDAAAWDVQEALGARRLDAALDILQRLLYQREAPMALIALLENRIRDLVVYRETLDRGWLRVRNNGAAWQALPEGGESLLADGLERDYHGMHPFRLGKLAEQAAHFTGRELQRALTLALAAHQQLVTTGLPPNLVLDLLLIQVLAAGRRPAAAGAQPSASRIEAQR